MSLAAQQVTVIFKNIGAQPGYFHVGSNDVDGETGADLVTWTDGIEGTVFYGVVLSGQTITVHGTIDTGTVVRITATWQPRYPFTDGSISVGYTGVSHSLTDGGSDVTTLILIDGRALTDGTMTTFSVVGDDGDGIYSHDALKPIWKSALTDGDALDAGLFREGVDQIVAQLRMGGASSGGSGSGGDPNTEALSSAISATASANPTDTEISDANATGASTVNDGAVTTTAGVGKGVALNSSVTSSDSYTPSSVSDGFYSMTIPDRRPGHSGSTIDFNPMHVPAVADFAAWSFGVTGVLLFGIFEVITWKMFEDAMKEVNAAQQAKGNAILGGTFEEKAPTAPATKSGFPEEDLSKPVTFNRKLARQGEKMREQGSKLQPFVQEVAKPLEEISAQDWKDKSLAAPVIEYTAASLGIPGFTEADKKAAEEKLIKKGKSFVEGVNQFIESPVETTKQALKAINENPGKFVGESVKSVIYDPEQIPLGGAASRVAGEIVTGAEKVAKKGAQAVAETPAYQGLANKAKTAKEVMQESFDAYKQAQTPQGQAVPAGASVGAAQTANKSIIDEAMTRATPELKQELAKLNPDEINIDVLNRHLDADTLPIRIQLSEGQATRNPQLFSDEMNNRGKNKELSNRYNQQNKQLVENIDAIKENAAPRVYGTNVVENGQSLIDAYLDIDKARKDAIGTAYTALKDKAGGSFPIDSKKFAENAYANLDKELKTEFLPDSLKKQIDGFKDGKPMSFQQFEALRTNLAAEMRKADRAGDGNTEFALSTVRQALEDLPLVGETKDLKALADTARGLAKERFDILDSDKAYKAAVNGKVAPDDFINKFVVNGKKNDIDTMVAHLGADSQAREVMAAGIVNWLKSKSGISSDGQGTFSQSGFNKALDNIDPKILNIVGPEVNKQLKALGNTARNIQERPVGGYVNESNTLVGTLAEKAKGGIVSVAPLVFLTKP